MGAPAYTGTHARAPTWGPGVNGGTEHHTQSLARSPRTPACVGTYTGSDENAIKHHVRSYVNRLESHACPVATPGPWRARTHARTHAQPTPCSASSPLPHHSHHKHPRPSLACPRPLPFGPHSPRAPFARHAWRRSLAPPPAAFTKPWCINQAPRPAGRRHAPACACAAALLAAPPSGEAWNRWNAAAPPPTAASRPTTSAGISLGTHAHGQGRPRVQGSGFQGSGPPPARASTTARTHRYTARTLGLACRGLKD